MSVQVTVNGEKRELPDGTTLAQLVDQLSLSPDKVAIEWNRRLAKREKLSAALADGDEIEIVTFVGGGA
jgi:sulfur carrier protein